MADPALETEAAPIGTDADPIVLPNADETIAYKIKRPLLKGEGSSAMDPEELRLRPFYVGDLRAMDRTGYSETDKQVVLISRLSGLDIATVERLHRADFYAILGVLALRMGKEVAMSDETLALLSRAIGGIV